jgi:hypothetical protein
LQRQNKIGNKQRKKEYNNKKEKQNKLKDFNKKEKRNKAKKYDFYKHEKIRLVQILLIKKFIFFWRIIIF